jgi:hypothetical protein
MSQIYQEDYDFNAYFYNITGKTLKLATADEIIKVSQQLLINFTITEHGREELAIQNQLMKIKIKQIELQMIQSQFKPIRSQSPDPKPKYPNPPKPQEMTEV